LFNRIAAGIRGEADQMVAAQELAAVILAEVRDKDLNRAVVTRLACFVAEGKIPLADVIDLLDDLAVRRRSTDPTKQLRKSAGAYFMGGMKRLFKQADSVD